MKTSRVARETARVTTSFSPTDFTPRRQTRLFAASLQAFTSNGDDSLQKLGKNVLKHEEPENDESPLSSLGSRGDFDIEDLLLEVSSSRKRRRGIDGPSTVVATTSTYTSTRVSPRNAGAKTEDVAIKKVKRARRQPPKGIVNEAGEEEIQAPANWEEIYNAVKEMRRERLAPVDTMGCETLADERVTPRVSRPWSIVGDLY